MFITDVKFYFKAKVIMILFNVTLSILTV